MLPKIMSRVGGTLTFDPKDVGANPGRALMGFGTQNWKSILSS